MDDVHAVMDAAGSERAALFGSSGGGMVSALFAAAHPERTAALVIANSTARALVADDYLAGYDPEEIEAILRRYEDDWIAAHIELVAPALVNDVAFLQWYTAYLRSSASPSVAASIQRMLFMVDIRDVLTRYKHRHSSCIGRATASIRCSTGGIWPRTFLVRGSRSCRGRSISGGSATTRRSSPRLRSSLPVPGPSLSPTVCSRPSCSPTSWGRPSTCRDWATHVGTLCSTSTTRSSAWSYAAMAAMKLTRRATASWRPSMGRIPRSVRVRDHRRRGPIGSRGSCRTPYRRDRRQ